MLRAEGLSAGYGAVEVLWDVDLEVRDGEIVALVGSNGAGKTTLLRAISGLIGIGAGRVCFEDEDLSGLRPEQIVSRGIAHVPEGRHLFQGLTVRENLLAGGYAHGDGADLDRAVELFPKLGERMSQLAGSLSGGEQQMCAISRGLMSRPKLLMIDELSLGLAPKLVDQIIDRLVAVAEQGTSLLLVEQDVDAALRIAGRGYVLETGRIAASGSSTELSEDPRVREAYLGVA
ncbi:MAG: branched-chain amino acid transport system ATP-binding protein [Thermoleophilaceae bacterium]|jgi:branched-chain amino acid transport system ATP-binding protein|nr:branched-chain amino acid transport system ATP-binding protein [Thermoleophilaceae bacterium]MEA2402794.1 branched-chain amino acid transport system ATP-binding protein [Thermoleophilaceae bacterium]